MLGRAGIFRLEYRTRNVILSLLLQCQILWDVRNYVRNEALENGHGKLEREHKYETSSHYFPVLFGVRLVFFVLLAITRVPMAGKYIEKKCVNPFCP